jgi:hypothetical protein
MLKRPVDFWQNVRGRGSSARVGGGPTGIVQEIVMNSTHTTADNGQAQTTTETHIGESQEDLGLSPKQWTVLKELAGGGSISAAARAAGVERHTFYRWMRNDPKFIAALNDWRNHAVQSARDTMAAMLDDAAKCVRIAIGLGHANVALEVLRRQGALEKIVEQSNDQREDDGDTAEGGAQKTPAK